MLDLIVSLPELRLGRLLSMEWRGKESGLRLPHCSFSLSFSFSFSFDVVVVAVGAMDLAQPLQPSSTPPLALHPPPPTLSPLLEAAPASEVLLLLLLIE